MSFLGARGTSLIFFLNGPNAKAREEKTYLGIFSPSEDSDLSVD